MDTIGFKNFKAFGDTMQTFSNKPITLIYGPNSVGKSSLLHSLIYTKNIMSGGNLDAHTLFFAGDELDLGGFKNFIHKHDIERVFSFESSAIKKFFEIENDGGILKLNGIMDLMYVIQKFNKDKKVDSILEIIDQIEIMLSKNDIDDIVKVLSLESEHIVLFHLASKKEFINLVRKAILYFKDNTNFFSVAKSAIGGIFKTKSLSIDEIANNQILLKIKEFIKENSSEIQSFFKNNIEIIDNCEVSSFEIFKMFTCDDFYDCLYDFIDCYIEVAKKDNSFVDNCIATLNELTNAKIEQFVKKYSNTKELDIPDEKIPAFLHFALLAFNNIEKLNPLLLNKIYDDFDISEKEVDENKKSLKDLTILEKIILSFDKGSDGMFYSIDRMIKDKYPTVKDKIENNTKTEEFNTKVDKTMELAECKIDNIEYFNYLCSLELSELKKLIEANNIEKMKIVFAIIHIIRFKNDEILINKILDCVNKYLPLSKRFDKNKGIYEIKNEIKSEITNSFDYLIFSTFKLSSLGLFLPGMCGAVQKFCELTNRDIKNMDVKNMDTELIIYGDFMKFERTNEKELLRTKIDEEKNMLTDHYNKVKFDFSEVNNSIENLNKSLKRTFMGAELFSNPQEIIGKILKEDMPEAMELTSKILDLFSETNAKINVSYKDEKFKKDFELYVDGEFFASGEFDDTYYSPLFKQTNGWKITLNKEHNFYKELAKLFNIKECVDVTIPDYSFDSIPDMLVELKKHSKTYGEEISGFVPQNLVLHLFKSTINQSISGEIHYFSPLRFYPTRKDLIQEHNKAENSVFGSSKDIWCALANENNANVVNELNEWLSNDKKLKTKYKIEVKKYHLDETSDEYITKLNFLDLHKNTAVTPRDMGLGVTQRLPVLTGCFLQNNTTLYVEQPELHLHPAVQCELADEFIHSAKEHNNKFYIETHSEHLLLRIMRRLRHSASGKIDQNNPLYITPDDVCLLYVDYADDCAFIRELELDYDGSLLDQWPNGFFEEGYKERFDIEEGK